MRRDAGRKQPDVGGKETPDGADESAERESEPGAHQRPPQITPHTPTTKTKAQTLIVPQSCGADRDGASQLPLNRYAMTPQPSAMTAARPEMILTNIGFTRPPARCPKA